MDLGGGMTAEYDVVLGPAAVRAIQDLRDETARAELAAALRSELLQGPNAAIEVEFRLDSDAHEAPDRAYKATPLSFGGYTAIHRRLTQDELWLTGQERNHAAADCLLYVVDIVPAESAFMRPRLV